MSIPNTTQLNYISEGDLSGNVTGATKDVSAHPNFSFSASWTATGSPVGDFTIEVSNDDSVWETVTDSTIAAGGGAGSHLWDIDNIRAKYVRLKYTSSSGGTGALVDAHFVIKGGVV